MCLSLSFLAFYISVCSLCLIIHYPPFVSLSHPQFSVSIHPRFIYLILSLRQPYFSIPYIPYEPLPIIQINPILTTPALV